jgi:hypothetical protein
MALKTYELFVEITHNGDGFEWGIGQEFVTELGGTEFQFLAGGQEDTIDEAAHRVKEEITALFKEG